MIEYGHDSQGGFYAIDEVERIAYYAYPSSPNADTAKSHVLAPRFVPGWIKAELSYRVHILNSTGMNGLPVWLATFALLSLCPIGLKQADRQPIDRHPNESRG